MKTSTRFSFFVFLFLFANICFAQTYGKLFTREEADKLFGPVVESVKITPADLKNAISQTEKYVMLRVLNGEAKILGDGRKAVFPSTDIAVGTTEIYHVYSKSLVEELLTKGAGEAVYLENRKEVFSVTYGENTLEMSYLCPPICF
jgi:hypothetical protein